MKKIQCLFFLLNALICYMQGIQFDHNLLAKYRQIRSNLGYNELDSGKLIYINKYDNIMEDILNVISYANKKCSGGEQQRAALARLLLKPCELILADEPTGSLDEQNKEQIYELLRMLQKQGKTVVVVTHDKSFMQRADYLIDLDNLANSL